MLVFTFLKMASRWLHETDDEAEENYVPAKKSKKACQKFKKEYQNEWQYLKPSSKGAMFAQCTICKTDFSISHGGRSDCKKHVDTKLHKDNAKSSGSKITAFLSSKQDSGSNLQREVTKAEVKMCQFIADCNLSLSSADKLTSVMKDMFPDSIIAKNLQCGRNKATVLIKKLAETAKVSLSTRMQNGPFSVSTDGSNDIAAKQFPIIIRTINQVTGLVSSELLSVPVCEGSATGENIFNLIDTEFAARRISWSNCLSLGCDNANVMTGRHKGVIAFARKKQPNIFLAGCTLHILHNAGKKAAAVLPPIETALIDLYYYFQKSIERQQRFQGTQALYDVNQRKLLKHVCTRWLSIGRCVQRLLDNWDPLKVFFSNEKASAVKSSYAAGKVEVIFNFVRSPTNKLYALFLSYTIKVFERFLLTFQAEEPKIHLLRRSLLRLLTTVLSRFVKPSAFSGKKPNEIEHKLPYNIKADKDLVIGESAREFLAQKETNHLRERKVKEFYSNVKLYFTTLVDYLKDHLPLEDPLLLHAEVTDVEIEASVSSLQFFLSTFPCFLPKDVTKDTIMEQFVQYQCTDISSYKADRIDQTWRAIGNMTDENGLKPFKELAEVMCGILTIPHSSAPCERIFSCVRKNRTPQRSSLSDDSMESLLVLKSVSSPLTFTDEDLDNLKGAYYRSLKSN